MSIDFIKQKYARLQKALDNREVEALREASGGLHTGNHFLYQQTTGFNMSLIQPVLNDFNYRRQRLKERLVKQEQLKYSIWHYQQPAEQEQCNPTKPVKRLRANFR